MSRLPENANSDTGRYDTLQMLLEMETTGNLFDFQVAGIPVWWFIRTRFQWLIEQACSGQCLLRTADSLSSTSRLVKIVESLKVATRGRRADGPCDVLCISTASARRHVTLDKRDFDVFFDVLSMIPGLDYVVAEFPDHQCHSKKPYSKRAAYADSIAVMGNFGRGMGPSQRRRSELEHLVQQLVMLTKEHQIPVSRESVARLVNREVGFIQYAMPWAERLLDRFRPEVVLVECAYAPSHMLVQYAARLRGIPVVEVQHGLIATGHIGYNFRLRSPDQLDVSPFPDEICLYGEHFLDIIVQSNPDLPKDRLKAVGNAYLWLRLQERQLHDREAIGQSILITSQPGLGSFLS